MADTVLSVPAAQPIAVTRLRIYLSLAFGVVCIALSAIFTHWAGVPGTVSAFYRVTIAAAVLAIPFGGSLRRRATPVPRAVWLLAAGAGVFFALDLALWNTSLFLTSAATATLLGNDAPIIVGLGALLLFHERLRREYWAGLALALAGMAIIAGRDVLAHSNGGAGDLLAATAGVSYAAYLLATQRLRVHLDTVSSLWIPALVGAALLLLFNIGAHRALWGFSGHAYLALLALGLVSQVAGWLAINYALGHMPASVVSVTLLGQPVLTAVFAVPLLGQALQGDQLLGGLVALVGIYLVNRGFGRR
ncbi:MAG TPA: DMT family transporter [Ktedonobacterales bacterium]|jgi:drug/metabolite transporter (DMT)-like permease|nr:DMT family transporter [Ktedonobacterales bacterium]